MRALQTVLKRTSCCRVATLKKRRNDDMKVRRGEGRGGDGNEVEETTSVQTHSQSATCGTLEQVRTTHSKYVRTYIPTYIHTYLHTFMVTTKHLIRVKVTCHICVRVHLRDRTTHSTCTYSRKCSMHHNSLSPPLLHTSGWQ